MKKNMRELLLKAYHIETLGNPAFSQVFKIYARQLENLSLAPPREENSIISS